MRPKDEEKRAAIREATFDLVAELGVSGLKMAHLAKKANISPSTLYVYFKDKEDLVLTLFREVAQSMLTDSVSEFIFGQPYKVNLRRTWEKYLGFRIENHRAIAFYEHVKVSPYYATAVREVKTVEMEGALELLRFGQAQGIIKQVDPKLLLESLGGMTDRMTDLFVNGGMELNEANIQTCFELMWDSISVQDHAQALET